MASPSSLPEAALTIEPPESVTTAAEEKKRDKEVAHKTKVIHFLGRTTPIILQNDNGPCPLLAICNVLLIKNQLKLSSDIPEISQEKLLSLVAERLLDSNSNTDNRDAGYVENQQQNIADAIDLLPRLATGIDVNIKFRRIDDFEFTRECAIFDLLDIPLYHGWIVDPQDYDTSIAIGSKSYNTLVEELVALDAQKMETDNKENLEGECVDFAAATTAALGVPSPCLSRGISFDNSPVEELVALDAQKRESDNKENSEEECVDFAASTTAAPGAPSPCLSRGISFDTSPVEELVALDAQKMESDNKENSEEACVDFAASTTAAHGVPSPCHSRGISFDTSPVTCPDSQKMRKEDYEEAEAHRVVNLSESEVSTSHNYIAVNDSEPVSLVGTVGENGVAESHNLCSHVASTSNTCNESTDHNFERKGSEIDLQEGVCLSPGTEQESHLVQAISEESTDQFTFPETSAVGLVNNVGISHESDLGLGEGHAHTAAGDDNNQKQVTSPLEILCTEQMPSHCETVDDSNVPVTASDSDSSTGRSVGRCETEGFIPSVDPSEPIYEGEESIIESETMANQSKEPMYEGEVVLAEQGFTGCVDDKKEEITPKEGEMIRNFLRSSASQLTICGLFRLRDDLKERELCVFFRNNHFNTMFKYEGELYILATDQGFINQPGIVWEKLNEVNGDTVYMTCNFKEFNGENVDNTAWDEQIARASTAEFLANSAQEDTTYDADLKLARDLQQLEFEQHPEQQHPPQHQSAVDGSRLTVGPQVSRIRPVPPNSSKQEGKSSKDKCTVM